MRGKAKSKSYLAGPCHPGITPACAGKRSPDEHGPLCGVGGITPAYAGKRYDAVSGLSLRRMTGSPPHVRGKASHRGLVWELPGITPACAGKRQSPSGSHRLSLDHPRMCGEKCLNSLMVAPVTGSPPHVRGKGDSEVISQCTHGITPACAGKSEPPGSGLGASGDHPRMCGEKTKPQRVAPPKLGSPPHVRGKVSQFVDGCACHGITPACAGKRGFRSNQPVYPRDHPRMCGEKTKKIP